MPAACKLPSKSTGKFFASGRTSPHALHFLGVIAYQVGQHARAVEYIGRAIKFQGNVAAFHNNLGLALQNQGNFEEAVACYRRAMALRPDYAEANHNLGTVFRYQGKLSEALTCYRRALELKPGFARAHSDLLLTLQYCPGVSLAQLAAAHAEYERLYAAPLRNTWRPHENVRDPHAGCGWGSCRPISTITRRDISSFRGLEHLDRGETQTVCYCDRKIDDDLTARLQAAAGFWCDATGWSDEQLAEQIRRDRIDVLFDLRAHHGNRLLALARKPAPLQVTWAGYVGTTGLKAMDYLLADRYQVPPDAGMHFAERVLRMPDGYVCFEPPGDAPAVAPLPALRNGYVTFGCFNNPAKINPAVVAVWASFCTACRSRLVLKYSNMSHPSIAGAVAERFAGHGIDPRRVECLDRSAQHGLSGGV